MMKSVIQSLLLVVYLSLSANAFAPSTNGGAIAFRRMDTRQFNYFDNLGSMWRNRGKKVSASHICIGPKTMDEVTAKAFLSELKTEIGDDPEKFASAAAEHSKCPSAKKGGDLGEFGPGMMVKNFDTVCFEDEVGVVHGPVSTQFGEHLILITKRTGDDN